MYSFDFHLLNMMQVFLCYGFLLICALIPNTFFCTRIFSLSGSYILARLMGRDGVYIRGYNIADNPSPDGVREVLKDMRSKFIEDFIVICTPNNTNKVLTQVCTHYLSCGLSSFSLCFNIVIQYISTLLTLWALNYNIFRLHIEHLNNLHVQCISI